MRDATPTISEQPGAGGQDNRLQQEIAALREENDLLRDQLARKVGYIRRKTDQMLTAMGTLPLRHEELDDETLTDVDPIGILTESIGHIIEHLHDTNRELTEKREFLQTVFASLESGIIVVREADHIITDVNETALRIMGRERDEVIGRTCFDFICNVSAGTCPMKEQGLDADNAEKSIIAANGRTVPILKTVGRVILGGAPHFIESFIDITAQKRAEDKLLALNNELGRRVEERTSELAASNRELESFCYSVSHDLRAPLRHINAYAAMIADESGEELDETARNYLQRVTAASRRMGMLIDDLLLFSQLARTKKATECIDLSRMVAEAIDRCREREPGRQVVLNIEQGLTACGDRALLAMVVENLIDNAWKYTATTADATIAFGKTRIRDHDAFFVRDNGIGFDMAYCHKLFKVFERLHGDEFEGTGIGLATVERVVHRHGGEIWAESTLGEGAVFYFTLPDAPDRQCGTDAG